MEITVISGKGGTGKTTLCASFGKLEEDNAILCDLDVDASNLPLIFKTDEIRKKQFTGLDLPVIDNDRCVKCGICASKCKFNAISDRIEIIRDRCEGCGVCSLVCPENAIDMIHRDDGFMVESKTSGSIMVHGDLFPGGEGSGKLVSMIRKRAREIAIENGKGLIISDGPPGIGCPVISSLTGSDLAVIVTEPSVSGISDLSRILDLCDHFTIPSVVIINRSDIDPSSSSRIVQMVENRKKEVIGMIPYTENILGSLDEGKTIMDDPGSETAKLISIIWKNIANRYLKT